MPVKNKISLQELAEFMTAADETLDKKTCEAFARTLFEVVEEALLTDKFVKVKGFGTFKLVAVSDRESVNINTGERFQIEGHTKVSFIPDNALKDEINRPFAHFETIDLSDDTEQAELDAIDAAAEEEAQEMQASQEAVEEAADEAGEDIVEESVEEEPAEKAVEQTAEEAPKEATAEENEESMEEPVATEPQTIVTAEKKEEEPAKAAASAEERQSVAEATVENTDDEAPAEETPAEESPESDADGQEEASTALPITYEYNEQPPRRPFNWWKAIGLFFAVLALMLASYFAGYYRLLCPCIIGLPEWSEPQPAQPAVKVQSAKPAPAKPQPAPAEATAPKIPENPLNLENPEQPEPRISKPAKPASALRKQQSAPAEVAPAPQADTTVATQPHTVARGETLYSIARKYYGSDKYVNVIIRHNRIKNPNNIEKGTTLQIPILDTGN